MSLYTSDNYYGSLSTYSIVKSCDYIKNGIEHEIVMNIVVSKRDDGIIHSIDTTYWIHYTYDETNGFIVTERGNTWDEMTPDVEEVFNRYCKELT